MNLSVLDKIGEWNPQLLRELKGRLKQRNIFLFSAVSICFQGLLYFVYESELPLNNGYSRYCVLSNNSSKRCIKDALDNFIINWQLWWLDIFICTSVIAIFVLLVGGTYLLIADLSKEESRGTLNFIRLSPQSARSILTGKILGVPILLYLLVILAVPLNLGAALGAGIPWTLLLSFYAVMIAGCAFFYSGALFLALASPKLMGFLAWLGSAAVLFFLWIVTFMTMDDYGHALGNAFDWLTLFYPGKVLAYLVHATSVAQQTKYFNLEQLAELSWFQFQVWENAFTGMFFILLNYAFWTYFLSQGLKRRFHNPIATSITKAQSYLLTTSLVTTTIGFSLEHSDYGHQLIENIVILLVFELFLFLGLIAALSPHRQTLQDWARYRHQAGEKKKSKNLLQDLIWGEKSPSTLAIGINLAIASLILLPLLFIFPFQEYTGAVFTAVLLNMSVMLIYASVAQLMLMMKSSKREIWAAGSVGALIIVPLIFSALFELSPYHEPFGWLFSILPIIGTENATAKEFFLALISQWMVILGLASIVMKRLKAAGASASKALLRS